MQSNKVSGPKALLFIVALMLVPSAIMIFNNPLRDDIPDFDLADRSEDIPTSIPLDPYHLQNDPRWADTILGNGPATIGEQGAALCSLSMCLAAIDIELPPDVLNKALLETEGFTQDNWLNWAAVETITDGKIRIRTPSAPSIALVRGALRDNLPSVVMIRIDNLATRWLLVVGFQNGDFQVKDPAQPTRQLIPLGSYNGSIAAIRIPAFMYQ